MSVELITKSIRKNNLDKYKKIVVYEKYPKQKSEIIFNIPKKLMKDVTYKKINDSWEIKFKSEKNVSQTAICDYVSSYISMNNDNIKVKGYY